MKDHGGGLKNHLESGHPRSQAEIIVRKVVFHSFIEKPDRFEASSSNESAGKCDPHFVAWSVKQRVIGASFVRPSKEVGGARMDNFVWVFEEEMFVTNDSNVRLEGILEVA
jgi:hypothetical protein